jgi:hypothetical protein
MHDVYWVDWHGSSRLKAVASALAQQRPVAAGKGGFMARTESKVRRIHPDSEQSTIEFMQIFHWNLANSQHIKNKTAYLEERGEDTYQVVETEHFINLTFSRDLDTPGIEHIRELESEYHRLDDSLPKIPEEIGYGGAIFVCLVLALFYGLGIVIAFFWIPNISKRNVKIREEIPEVTSKRRAMQDRMAEIVEECENWTGQAPTAGPAAELNRSAEADTDVSFWDGLEKSDAEELQEYLIRYPDGRFAELAKVKLERLGSAPL